MSKEKTYSELLKDPRWQKKRLQILERENFECENCGDKDKTLHIHHDYYEKHFKPWDYPSESLHCLCERCHLIIKEIKSDIKKSVDKLEVDISLLSELFGYINTMIALEHGMKYVQVDSYEELMGASGFIYTNRNLTDCLLQIMKNNKIRFSKIYKETYRKIYRIQQVGDK